MEIKNSQKLNAPWFSWFLLFLFLLLYEFFVRIGRRWKVTIDSWLVSSFTGEMIFLFNLSYSIHTYTVYLYIYMCIYTQSMNSIEVQLQCYLQKKTKQKKKVKNSKWKVSFVALSRCILSINRHLMQQSDVKAFS